MTRRWPDLTTLELLIGIDDHGSLSAASRSANIAQPNASRAVKALERQLGMPLIHRRSTGAALTPQGTVIVHWARRVLANSRQLRLEEHTSELQSLMRISDAVFCLKKKH